jgi:hypothetical protein
MNVIHLLFADYRDLLIRLFTGLEGGKANLNPGGLGR